MESNKEMQRKSKHAEEENVFISMTKNVELIANLLKTLEKTAANDELKSDATLGETGGSSNK